MNRYIINHYFYKTLSFWAGILFMVVDVYSIVQRGYINFNFFLDLVGFIIGLFLILSSLLSIRKDEKP